MILVDLVLLIVMWVLLIAFGHRILTHAIANRKIDRAETMLFIYLVVVCILTTLEFVHPNFINYTATLNFEI